jgi:hypothetical protein
VITSTKLYGKSFVLHLGCNVNHCRITGHYRIVCHSSNNRQKSRAALRSVSLDVTMHPARDSKVALFVLCVERTQAVRRNAGFRNRLFKLQDKSSQYEGQTVAEDQIPFDLELHNGMAIDTCVEESSGAVLKALAASTPKCRLRDDPRPPILAGIRGEIRLKNRLRRQWHHQGTRSESRS